MLGHFPSVGEVMDHDVKERFYGWLGRGLNPPALWGGVSTVSTAEP